MIIFTNFNVKEKSHAASEIFQAPLPKKPVRWVIIVIIC